MNEEQFWANMDKRGPSECWQWLGRRLPRGYGVLSFNSRASYSHRLSWELENCPIPRGLCVCHRCDNPPCCNPAHLFIGSQRDNIRDMMSKVRKHQTVPVRGERASGAKLSDDDVVAMRCLRIVGALSMGKLGRMFGVGKSQVCRILNRQSRV